MTSERTRRGERGTAAVEMAVLLPLLWLILLGAIDFGRVFYASITIADAAQQAAVFAARSQVLPAAAVVEAIAYGEAGGFLRAENTVLEGPTLVAGEKVFLARVRLTYTFRPLTPIPLAGPIPVSAVATAPLPGTVLP